MEKYFFVINPVAGAGRSSKAFDLIENRLREKEIDYDYAVSLYPGHAVELTRAALSKGEKCIVSVGGDGTLREVASVLANTEACLGIIPCGTGNDFAKVLGIVPDDIPAALDTLLTGKVRKMDAGMANDEFFINVSGFGFDADVIVNTESFKKRFRGMIPYMLGIVRSLVNLRKLDLTVTANGETKDISAIMISAANGTHFGGGMNVAPFADTQDGLLDVYIVKSMGRITFLALLPKFIKGKHTDLSEIIYFRAPELTVACKQNSRINLDGDLRSGTPVTFRILKGAMNIIVPERQ
jgi:YegS/Rv2252/BmrU family lipid kinase